MPETAFDNLTKVTDLETRKKSVNKLRKHLSGINLIGFCYGTIFIQNCLLHMHNAMVEKGYTKTEIALIKDSLGVVNLAPICNLVDTNLAVGQIFFATEQDNVIKARINHSDLDLERAHDLLQLYYSGNSLLLLSHAVSEANIAVRIKRKEGTFKFGDNVHTISTKCTYDDLMELISAGKVTVQEVPKKHDASEATGHSMRRYLNTERLSGVQGDKGQIFTFRSALGVRTILDYYQSCLNESLKTTETGKPRQTGNLIRGLRETLTQPIIESRSLDFHLADSKFRSMIDAARKNGSLIERP